MLFSWRWLDSNPGPLSHAPTLLTTSPPPGPDLGENHILIASMSYH